MKIDSECSKLRLELTSVAERVRALLNHPVTGQHPADADLAEMRANVMLAYRHLEDSIMRLGKAIQAFDGGRSIYHEHDKARASKG